MTLKPEELLKAAYTNYELLDQIPIEALDPYQHIHLQEIKKQKEAGFTPTFESVYRSITETLKEVDQPHFKESFKQVNKASKLDLTSQQIQLQAARTRASRKIMQQICTLPEEEVKTIQALERRLEQLKKDTSVWPKPVNIKDWQTLQRLEETEVNLAVDWFKENNVPLKKKVLYAFITMTNGGKTILKTWMSWLLIKAHQNVLFLAQEEPHQDTIRRIHQMTLGLSEDEYALEIANGYSTVGQKYAEIAKANNYGEFIVAEWAGVKIEVLNELIKTEEAKAEIGFDAIIIDYAKLVDVGGNLKAEWERVAKVFQELKSLAMSQNKIVITSMQLNREASDRLINTNQTPDLHNVAGAYEATHHVNYCWAVQLQYPSGDIPKQLDKNTQLGTYTLTVQKQKYGKLRKGDRMSFVWTADHILTQRPGLEVNDVQFGL
jgi:archaellum biogenesis ATPase FlaH